VATERAKADTDLHPGPKHAPAPTRALAAISLPIVPIFANACLFRVHRNGFDPVHLVARKPPQFRYDDPKAEFGTLYVGEALEVGLIETLLRNPRLRLVARAEVDVRRWSVIRPERDLRLVDFAGVGLSIVGTDGGVNTGPYLVSRAWAAALFHHADMPDGILYPSRHDPSLKCLAIFGHPDITFKVDPPETFERNWLTATLKRYGKALSP
jgi:hypothetical protein